MCSRLAPQEPGFKIQTPARARPPTKELFQISHGEHGDNPGQEKEGSTVSYKL